MNKGPTSTLIEQVVAMAHKHLTPEFVIYAGSRIPKLVDTLILWHFGKGVLTKFELAVLLKAKTLSDLGDLKQDTSGLSPTFWFDGK